MIGKQGEVAAKLATNGLAQHGEPTEAIRTRLDQRGFTAEQVLGDWFPEKAG